MNSDDSEDESDEARSSISQQGRGSTGLVDDQVDAKVDAQVEKQIDKQLKEESKASGA